MTASMRSPRRQCEGCRRWLAATEPARCSTCREKTARGTTTEHDACETEPEPGEATTRDSSEPARPRTVPPSHPPGPAPKGQRAKVPALISLDAVQPRSIDWLWRGWIPAGMFSICDGLPGVGKSTMLVDIAARVTTGREMPDGTPGVEPGVVLFLAYEDATAEILRPRFDTAGADVSRIRVHDPEADDRFTLGRESHLEQLIREHDARLVIVDPLITAVTGGADMHKGQDARRVLTPVARAAERTGAAVLGVRHLNKGMSRSALLRGEGSIGIGGTARTVLIVGVDPDDPDCRILARSKGNLAPPGASRRFALVGDPETDAARVEWRGESRYMADDLTGSEEESRSGALDDAVAFLRSELADGAKPAHEVIEAGVAAGHAERTIKRARKRLGVRSEREGGRWILSLPGVPSDGSEDASG